jgi:hypothetical protein
MHQHSAVGRLRRRPYEYDSTIDMILLVTFGLAVLVHDVCVHTFLWLVCGNLLQNITMYFLLILFSVVY